MTLQHIVRRIDDLDGSELGEDATPFFFSVGGVHYEIDLSDDNMALFHSALAPFLAAARRAGQPPASPLQTRADQISLRRDIRDWARANGFDVSARGRISDEVLAAYGRSRSRGPLA